MRNTKLTPPAVRPLQASDPTAADLRSLFKRMLSGQLSAKIIRPRTEGDGFRERLQAGDERALAVMRPTFEFDTEDDVLNHVANRVLGSFFDSLQHLSQLSEDDLHAISVGSGGEEITELVNVWCESLLDRWMTLLADLLYSAGEDPVQYLARLKVEAAPTLKT